MVPEALREPLDRWIDGLRPGELCVDVVVLFGSAAAGRWVGRSDVDLYVRLRPGRRWDVGRQLSVAAQASRILRREIDLVVEDDATSVLLRWRVADEGVPLWERCFVRIEMSDPGQTSRSGAPLIREISATSHAGLTGVRERAVSRAIHW